MIGPTNFTFGGKDTDGTFPVKWSYRHGISTRLILYNSFTATFGPADMRPRPGTAGLDVLNKAWGGSISLLSDQTGQLKQYVDRGANGDFLHVVFDPPLPACGRDDKPPTSSFSISIRAAADLVGDSVDTRCGDRVQVLDWHPSQPIWVSRQPFRSEISRPDARSVSVAVKLAA